MLLDYNMLKRSKHMLHRALAEFWHVNYLECMIEPVEQQTIVSALAVHTCIIKNAKDRDSLIYKLKVLLFYI